MADKGRIIRIPVHMVDKLNKVTYAERQLVQRLGREPTPAERAEELDFTEFEVREVVRLAQQPVSLDKPIGEDEDTGLGDFVPDDSTPSPFELASENLRRQNLRKALNVLPPRERGVIEMLRSDRDATVDARGSRAGVQLTRERIRQIEGHTLRKLLMAWRATSGAEVGSVIPRPDGNVCTD